MNSLPYTHSHTAVGEVQELLQSFESLIDKQAWDNIRGCLQSQPVSGPLSLSRIVEYKPDLSRTLTFEENINKKLKAHLEYDTKKGYTNNITSDDVQTLFVKQNGECLKCGEFMKTCGYGKGDKKQFSIDRIDSKKGHTKDNIQLFCWCCNRAKKNRF